MRILVWLKEDFHYARDYTGEGCDLLRSHGQVEVLVENKDHGPDRLLDHFLEVCPDADAVVIGPWHRPATSPGHWRKAEKLRVIAGTFDHRFEGWVDFDEMESRGVAMIDSSRSMTPTVAEFALTMTLNLIRNVPTALNLVREGGWGAQSWDNGGFVFGDLTGRDVGLAGFGSINRRYAELLKPFRCTVRIYDPFVSDKVLEQHGVSRVGSLVELARLSEVFVIGIPPTPATQKIIDREVIHALPKGSIVIHMTRMAVIDQEALWQRVKSGQIMLGTDVFDPEPPPADAWFRRQNNVLATPHMAGGEYTTRRCFTDACKDVVSVLTGGAPKFQATRHDHRCYQGSPGAHKAAPR